MIFHFPFSSFLSPFPCLQFPSICLVSSHTFLPFLLNNQAFVRKPLSFLLLFYFVFYPFLFQFLYILFISHFNFIFLLFFPFSFIIYHLSLCISSYISAFYTLVYKSCSSSYMIIICSTSIINLFSRGISSVLICSISFFTW